jgi:hypothetical protein
MSSCVLSFCYVVVDTSLKDWGEGADAPSFQLAWEFLGSNILLKSVGMNLDQNLSSRKLADL